MEIGLFLISHKGAIDSFVDLNAIAEEFSFLSTVKIYDDLFSLEDYNDLYKTIRQNSFDGIIIAGYSKDFYINSLGGKDFINSIEKAGINPNRIGFVDIGEYFAFHYDFEDSPFSISKCWSYIRAKARISLELTRINTSLPAEMNWKQFLSVIGVIGLNHSTLATAYYLEKQGFSVEIICEQEELDSYGDLMIKMPFIYSGISSSSLIKINTLSYFTEFYGQPGNYHLCFNQPNGNEKRLKIGGLIITEERYLEQIPFWKSIWSEKMFNQKINKTKYAGFFKETSSTDKIVFLFNKNENNIDQLNKEAKQAASFFPSSLSNKTYLEIENDIRVSISRCSGCGICQRICSFGANYIKKGQNFSRYDPERCQKCGACVAACPNEARDTPFDTQEYYKKGIKVLANSPHIDRSLVLLFMCNRFVQYYSTELFLDRNFNTLQESSVYPLQLSMNCLLRLDVQFTLEALLNGFSGIGIISCSKELCRYPGASAKIRKKINSIKNILAERAIDPNRVKLIENSPGEDEEFLKDINEFLRIFKGQVKL